jgi:molecular chaperone GrpE
VNENEHPAGAMPEPGEPGAEQEEESPDVESPAVEAEDEIAAEEADELTQLRQELEEVCAREAQYLDGWQRARAELDNARKRFRREQEQVWSAALADTLARMLPIVDDIERAIETLPEDLSDHPWVEGVGLIRRKLDHLLTQAGVEPVEAEGQEFDPFTHQAVTHEPSDTVQAGHIIAELQRGYRMGDRILRPSMVRVSSGPAGEAEQGPEPEADQERMVE